MLANELRDYYGGWAKMSRALDMNQTTYLKWRKKGYIPYVTQCLIEKKTKRRFIASQAHCQKDVIS